MKTLADLLLEKVIEDLSPLTNNIERLHQMGYVNNFTLSGGQLMCLESRLCVSLSDIVVDEFLEYTEDGGVLQRVTLFAIHELKYRRKGLFMANDGDGPLSGQWPRGH